MELLMGLTFAAGSFIMLLLLVFIVGKIAQYFSPYKDM